MEQVIKKFFNDHVSCPYIIIYIYIHCNYIIMYINKNYR